MTRKHQITFQILMKISEKGRSVYFFPFFIQQKPILLEMTRKHQITFQILMKIFMHNYAIKAAVK